MQIAFLIKKAQIQQSNVHETRYEMLQSNDQMVSENPDSYRMASKSETNGLF